MDEDDSAAGAGGVGVLPLDAIEAPPLAALVTAPAFAEDAPEGLSAPFPAACGAADEPPELEGGAT